MIIVCYAALRGAVEQRSPLIRRRAIAIKNEMLDDEQSVEADGDAAQQQLRRVYAAIDEDELSYRRDPAGHVQQDLMDRPPVGALAPEIESAGRSGLELTGYVRLRTVLDEADRSARVVHVARTSR